MKSVSLFILGLLVATSTSRSQSPGTNYVGKTIVAELGTIAFPTGEWLLEFRRIQSPTNSMDRPDYFAFRRVGDRLERLAILRYPPTTTPRRLDHMLDTVGETLGEGIPREENKRDDHSLSQTHPMRLEPHDPKPTERNIAYSFIYVRPRPAPAWLCHSELFLHGDTAFVIAHTSTSVMSPEIVGEVRFLSQFLPNTKPARKDK